MQYKIIIIGLFSIFYVSFFNKSICIFYNLFGIPCLTCGITRAYIALFHLNLKKSFIFHPLFLLVPFLIIFRLKTKILS
ncbi:DUF2752 domain-containing protein, partial [uncultured Cetobacterium sp.]